MQTVVKSSCKIIHFFSQYWKTFR